MKLAMPRGWTLAFLVLGVGLFFYLSNRRKALGAGRTEPRVEVFMGDIERYE